MKSLRSPRLTKRQLSRRRNLSPSTTAAEPDPAEVVVLDVLYNAGHVGYRAALTAYAKGYGAAAISRIAASPGVAPESHQAERRNDDKPAPVQPKVKVTGRSTSAEPPRFLGRLVAVFSQANPRCPLCDRGIKARGGVELRNAGQWWPCCRDCKGRVAVSRATRQTAVAA